MEADVIRAFVHGGGLIADLRPRPATDASPARAGVLDDLFGIKLRENRTRLSWTAVQGELNGAPLYMGGNWSEKTSTPRCTPTRPLN